MSPMRGFLLAFTAGVALLFSGHGLIAVAFADAVVETHPVDISRTSAVLSVA